MIRVSIESNNIVIRATRKEFSFDDDGEEKLDLTPEVASRLYRAIRTKVMFHNYQRRTNSPNG